MYRSLVKFLIWLTGVFEHRGVKRRFIVRENIVYTPKAWPEEVRGDFYCPIEEEEGEEAFPVVLLAHGGGWAENDNRYHMVRVVEQLVNAGYAVFNVTYRLAPDHRFPAQVDDLEQAVQWLVENADSEGIDMQKLALMGYSAGGHLVELLAMRELPRAVRVRAVVAGGVPHFMRLDPDYPLVVQLMGHDWQDDPDRYRAATPVDVVTEEFPPVFIYHGGKDKLVPRQHVGKWVKRLEQLDVKHEVYWVRGRGHIGTFLMPRSAIQRATIFLGCHFGKT